MTLKPGSFSGLFCLCFILCALSIPNSLSAQNKWKNYAGVYFAGDAAMYYLGPSLMLGTTRRFSEGFSASGFGQAFYKKRLGEEYRAVTVGALLQYNFGESYHKGFYFGLGPAYQYAYENYYSDVSSRHIFVPVYRLGYSIPWGPVAISPELCLTGPYSYDNTVERLTLTLIGVRLFFINEE